MMSGLNSTIHGLFWASPLCCFILICVFPSRSALALDPTKSLTRYGHDVWQREQGLPHNTIHSILQTRDGYIWLATDEGLARFDGVRFKVFDSQNTREIASNQIQLLFEDRQGELWIGTAAGLTRYKNQRFDPFTPGDAQPHEAISSICEDGKDDVWVGTAAGLWRFDGGEFRTYTTRDGLPSDSIRSVYEGRSGSLWVSTLAGLARINNSGITAYRVRDGLPNDSVVSVYEDSKGNLWVNTLGGLARFKDGKFTTWTTSNGLLNDRVWAIHEDRRGVLWIGTDGGLNSLSNGVVSAYTTANGLPDNSVWSIYEDSAGVLWLATPGGIGRMKDGKLSSYTSREGLSDDVVMSLYEDREGSLWIGTEAGGLNRLRDAKFTSYSTRDGLTNDVVWSICESLDGSLWAGTNGGGLNRLRDGRWSGFTTKEGLVSNIVRALCQDRSGNLWAGTPAGLSRLRGEKVTTFTVQDGLSSNAVSAIAEDTGGSIWIGTLGGLTRLKDGKFTVFTTRDGLADDGVISLCAARGGGMWIGTRSGDLVRFEGGRFTSHRATSRTGGAFVDDTVRSIYEDEDGVVWVGTRRSGLFRFKDGQFAACTTRDGLFDDCVFQIMEDRSQFLWMSSPRGVFRVSKSTLNDLADGRVTRISSEPYGTADGMLSRECNGGQPAGCKSNDGRLWFPTVKGIAVIDPQNMPLNTEVPPVVIERAIIDGDPVELGDRVELAPGKQRYEFYYTALSLIAPEKVRFRYKLEGFDKDWVEAGAERVASYTHIPPGSYTFRVRACNNDGVWNEAGAAFNLYLRPYFYQTYWFYAVCAAALGLMGLAAYRIRVSRIRAQFAAVLEERNRMGREIHDTLAQGFVGIALQLQAVGKALPDSPQTASQHLALAQSMVGHSLNEARRTVWNLRSRALETNDLRTALSATAAQMTEGTGVTAEVLLTGENRRLPSRLENNALRIAQEALTNALKHAAPNRITIELNFSDTQLELRIRDNGRGFDADSTLATADGHFGLLGMRERVEHIGGRLTLASRAGEGTEIVVTVPLEEKNQ